LQAPVQSHKRNEPKTVPHPRLEDT